MDNNKQALIKQLVEGFLDRMGLPGEVTVEEVSSTDSKNKISYQANIDSDYSKFLIGKLGNNLMALQHVLRVIINKQIPTEERIDLNVDVNNYKLDQKRHLLNLAHELAAQATTEGKTVVMEPMNSFERRLVHLELEDFHGVKTESIGEGEKRKIIIKPESLKEELGFDE